MSTPATRSTLIEPKTVMRDMGLAVSTELRLQLAIPTAHAPYARERYCFRPSVAGHFLDAGDHVVDGLLDRHLVGDDGVDGLHPDVLVVEGGELVVLAHLVTTDAGEELVAHGAAMHVAIPERGLLRRGLDREPAAERAFDVGL